MIIVKHTAVRTLGAMVVEIWHTSPKLWDMEQFINISFLIACSWRRTCRYITRSYRHTAKAFIDTIECGITYFILTVNDSCNALRIMSTSGWLSFFCKTSSVSLILYSDLWLRRYSNGSGCQRQGPWSPEISALDPGADYLLTGALILFWLWSFLLAVCLQVSVTANCIIMMKIENFIATQSLTLWPLNFLPILKGNWPR